MIFYISLIVGIAGLYCCYRFWLYFFPRRRRSITIDRETIHKVSEKNYIKPIQEGVIIDGLNINAEEFIKHIKDAHKRSKEKTK